MSTALAHTTECPRGHLLEATGARILAHVFVNRVAWFLAVGDELRGHGTAETFGELRMIQVRAGIATVALHTCAQHAEVAAARACHAGEWTETTAAGRAQLALFFALTGGGSSVVEQPSNSQGV